MLFSIISPHGASLFSNTSGPPLPSQLPGYLLRPMLILNRQGRLEVKDTTKPQIFLISTYMELRFCWEAGALEFVGGLKSICIYARTHKPEEKIFGEFNLFSLLLMCNSV